jgi:hypothetical protein
MRGEDRLVESWKERARRELIELRRGPCTWSYRRAHVRAVEPTVLSCLGLLASAGADSLASEIATGRQAAEWLAKFQRPDGSLAVAQGLESPGWATPYGLLLWSTLAGHLESRRRALDWLLREKGATLPRAQGADNVIGHDPSLVGWPWVPETHSWVEPTGLSILALCRAGVTGHSRVAAGIDLILDRALENGGWNCGNKSVFGTELRPQPAPTGLALLALAATGNRSAAVGRAVAYLRSTLCDLRAPVSVGWGVLGLRAHDALPREAETWLKEAHARCSGKPDATMGVALLLLASSEPGLSLLVTPAREL